MGEAVVNKEEAPKVEAEAKKEESPAPAEEDKKKEEEPPSDAPPSPPPPVILGVEVHCTGCAKRMRRSLLRCKGVEAVHVDMAANHITVKGDAVDPDALCQRLRSKTKREITVISPVPPPPPPAPADEAADAPPPPPPPAEDPVRTVELAVNMHCDACALQLQKKMLKMKGVQTAETDLAAGKLTVTGTVEGETIVEYIHRRTGKLATVVPPPEPPKEEAAPPAEAEQKPADEGDGGKKEEDEKKPAAEAEQAAGEEKKEAGDEKPGKQEGEEGVAVAVDGFPPEETMKRMVYWPYGGAHYSYKLQPPPDAEEAMMARRMAMHAMPPPLLPHHHHHHHPYAMTPQHQWMPPPPPPPQAPMYYGNSYMMERPPQMFSDENPNACVIS